MRRFREPLRVSGGLDGDVLRPRTVRGVRLFQEVDGDPSAEITLDARLTQLSAHEKNRCVLSDESVGLFGGNFVRRCGPAGTIQGQF
jgi:hypothetical protein